MKQCAVCDRFERALYHDNNGDSQTYAPTYLVGR